MPWTHSSFLQKFICWKPNPQSDDFRWWDHLKIIRSWVCDPHEGRAHMNGIRALVKEAWNTCSSLLFRDMSRKRPSLRQPCWHPDLGLLASRTVINNVVYKPPSLAFCNSSLHALKHWTWLNGGKNCQSCFPFQGHECETGSIDIQFQIKWHMVTYSIELYISFQL